MLPSCDRAQSGRGPSAPCVANGSSALVNGDGSGGDQSSSASPPRDGLPGSEKGRGIHAERRRQPLVPSGCDAAPDHGLTMRPERGKHVWHDGPHAFPDLRDDFPGPLPGQLGSFTQLQHGLQFRPALRSRMDQCHHVGPDPGRRGQEVIGWRKRERTALGILEEQGEVLEMRVSVPNRETRDAEPEMGLQVRLPAVAGEFRDALEEIRLDAARILVRSRLGVERCKVLESQAITVLTIEAAHGQHATVDVEPDVGRDVAGSPRSLEAPERVQGESRVVLGIELEDVVRCPDNPAVRESAVIRIAMQTRLDGDLRHRAGDAGPRCAALHDLADECPGRILVQDFVDVADGSLPRRRRRPDELSSKVFKPPNSQLDFRRRLEGTCLYNFNQTRYAGSPAEYA